MKRFAWVMGLLGALCIAVGIGLVVHTRQFIDRAQELPGVVIEMIRSGQKLSSKTYKPRVRFETPSGETVEFVAQLASSPPVYQIDEAVRVYFDPANPSESQLKGFLEQWGIASLMVGLGLVFLLLGVGLGAVKWLQSKKLSRLRAEGYLILAKLDKIELDTHTTVNDRHPWRVHAHWMNPVTGERCEFASEMLWEDPTSRLGLSPVRIYIERGNPGRYAMDLY